VATLYIDEYPQVPSWVPVTLVPGDPLAVQSISIGASSVQSAPFNPFTRMVLIATDTACSIAFGPNPTADPLYRRMAANETRFYAVNQGERVAVIVNT
jgi:hypothetical protein